MSLKVSALALKQNEITQLIAKTFASKTFIIACRAYIYIMLIPRHPYKYQN